MVGNEIADQVANQAKPGLIDTIKESIQPEAVMKKLRMSRNTLIDIGLYGGIGFLTGFLLKKYSTLAIVFALFIILFIVLQQFGFMSVLINWSKVYELMGIQPAAVIGDNMLMMVWGWMKANWIISASFVIGFLVGLKIG